MAVLMQVCKIRCYPLLTFGNWSSIFFYKSKDLMEIRESNAELRATVYMLDRERESLELKVAALQSQLQAFALVKSENQVRRIDYVSLTISWRGFFIFSFVQGEGNDKESRLQERLKEVAVTLEKVNKNADLRQKQSIELANQLKSTNWFVLFFLRFFNFMRCWRSNYSNWFYFLTKCCIFVPKNSHNLTRFREK